MNASSFLKYRRNQVMLAGIVVLIVLFFLYVLVNNAHQTILSKSGISGTNSVAVVSTATSSLGVITRTMYTSSLLANQKISASSSVSRTPGNTPITIVSSGSSVATASARELSDSGAALLKSLVNIVCVSADPSVPSISGSGVIIDPQGIILTAAHVAQLFLLQDYLGPDKVECIVRTGSPARRAYLAEPIYVSPTWVNANLSTLKETAPKGTGENDFALLAITATATSTPLPTSFPAIPLTGSDDPQVGQQVAIGSYGAQYLTPSELNYSLYPILVFGSIQNRYTFSSTANTVDLISIQGSAASQEGSSGGGIVNDAGELIGIITTSSTGGDIATRSLNAVTIGHMRRSYLADTGNNLDSVLASESISTLVTNFANESRILGAELAKNL